MKRKPMSEIVAEAKKRRAKYLKDFKRYSKISIADFARKHNVEPTRMGQLLNKAKKEADNEGALSV